MAALRRRRCGACRWGLTRRRIFQPRQVCFNAQQAAEKAIKALLVAEQIGLRFTHDLELLAQLLPPPRVLTTAVTEFAWLGQWATASRYPDGVEPTWADARRAVKMAEALVADVRASLEGHMKPKPKLIEVALPLEAINRESAGARRLSISR